MQRGDLIGGTYQILDRIGKGGLSEIYLAYHRNLQKHVVVKKIKSHVSSLVDCRIEADILKNLHHRFLPQVYDFIETQDGIFTVIDYISGHDFQYYADMQVCFPEEQLVYWLRELLDVLDYLHTRKPPILHCDIKPGNIILMESGDICLIDFNISLDGENSKELVGMSSTYASPEQVRKAQMIMQGNDGSRVKLDARSDLYSAGAVFYRLMCGCGPEDRRKGGIRLTDRNLPYDPALCNIIDKCMDPEPRKRFASAKAVLAALDHRERWTREWQRLTRAGRIADLVMILFSAVFLSLAFVSWRGERREEFFAAYEEYLAVAEAMDDALTDESAYLLTVSEGTALLNDSAYAQWFARYPEEKANVLYGIAQACMELADYGNAETFLAEAVTLDAESADLYRDLAICCAYNGKIATAKMYLSQAAALGLGSEEESLVQAEIEYLTEDYEEAYTYAVAAAESSDSQIEKRASALVINSASRLGNYADCINFVEGKLSASSGSSYYLWLRRGGALCLTAVDAGDESWLSYGIDLYERLQESGYAGFDDLYALALLYERDGSLTSARELLLSLRKEYPEEYTIPMELAYVHYAIENLNAISSRNYLTVQIYYEEALSLWEAAGAEADEALEELADIVDLLIEKGWLEDT